MLNIRHFNFWEHFNLDDSDIKLNSSEWESIKDKKFKYSDKYCFKKQFSDGCYKLTTEYFIGVDWLLEDNASIYISPKLNTKVLPNFDKEDGLNGVNTAQITGGKFQPVELDYLAMLNECVNHEEVLDVLNEVLIIDWDAKEISIEQTQDLLSPFLIVQFLKLLKKIVKKGLKKSYYEVEENLKNRVKGKILVSKNISKNFMHANFTSTICKYQEFGINSVENQFLKKVLLFCLNYINHHKKLFNETYELMNDIISFCIPAFDNVSLTIDQRMLRDIKPSVFFEEYEYCIRIGKQILKRFGFNITSTNNLKVETPPFWIDMPKLFELYVYSKLLNFFQGKNEVKFQFSTYGNALDFLITKSGYEMVVDAKYKLAYSDTHVHQDIRQVSGYSRLKVVYDELKITDDRLIECLIIYPNLITGKYEIDLKDKLEIKAYKGIYKLGINLPVI